MDIEECKHSKAFANIAAQIKKRKYGVVSVSEDSAEQEHMTASEKKKLENLLKEFDVVFDRKLGHYPHKQIHLDLEPGSVPVAQRPYTVVHKNKEVFKDKLEYLCNKEVLEETVSSAWGSPTMINTKKDGSVRWISASES